MAQKDYSGRATVDKLAITPGAAVAIDDGAWPLATDLRRQIADRARILSPPVAEPLDVVLATIDPTTDVVALLRCWRLRLRASGGIWLLTWKRGQQRYVDQRQLISRGPAAVLVDNKVCSISATVSALRLVIPRANRI
jgi:hypothetical protein